MVAIHAIKMMSAIAEYVMFRRILNTRRIACESAQDAMTLLHTAFLVEG